MKLVEKNLHMEIYVNDLDWNLYHRLNRYINMGKYSEKDGQK